MKSARAITISILIILTIALFVVYQMYLIPASDSPINLQQPTSNNASERKPLPLLDIEVDVPIEVSPEVDIASLNTGIYAWPYDIASHALELLPVATNGDPRAQFHLAEILYRCKLFMEYSQPKSADSDPLMNEVWQYQKARCASFQNGIPNSLNDEAYWLNLAKNNNYAPAEMYYLTEEQLNQNPDATRIVQEALATGDIYAIGWLAEKTMNSVSRSALQLLTCDLGADCTASSKEVWRMNQVFACYAQSDNEALCDFANLALEDWLKLTHTDDEFYIVAGKRELMLNAIRNATTSNLSLDDILN